MEIHAVRRKLYFLWRDSPRNLTRKQAKTSMTTSKKNGGRDQLQFVTVLCFIIYLYFNSRFQKNLPAVFIVHTWRAVEGDSKGLGENDIDPLAFKKTESNCNRTRRSDSSDLLKLRAHALASAHAWSTVTGQLNSVRIWNNDFRPQAYNCSITRLK